MSTPTKPPHLTRKYVKADDEEDCHTTEVYPVVFED